MAKTTVKMSFSRSRKGGREICREWKKKRQSLRQDCLGFIYNVQDPILSGILSTLLKKSIDQLILLTGSLICYYKFMKKLFSIIALLCTSLPANAFESNQLLESLTELSKKGDKMMAEQSVSLSGVLSSSLLSNKKSLQIYRPRKPFNSKTLHLLYQSLNQFLPKIYNNHSLSK